MRIMKVSPVEGAVMDPFSTALIGWATGKGATASERALVRAWKGDVQSNELTKIAREAVAACVEEIVALPDRKIIEEVLLRNQEASPNFQALESQDLRRAIVAALGQPLEILTEQGFDLDADRFIDRLTIKIETGIKLNAARGGALKPFAELMQADHMAGAQDRAVIELSAIRDLISYNGSNLTAPRMAERDADAAEQSDAERSSSLQPLLRHDVEFSTEFWLPHLKVNNTADRLLAGDPSVLRGMDSPLSRLKELVTKALSIEGLSVAIRPQSEPIAIPILTQDKFWAALLADLALQRSDPGSAKWLLKETITGDGHRSRLARIESVWDSVSQDFLSLESGVNRIEVVGRLVDACLATNGRKRLKGQLRFLLDLVMTDPMLKAIFRSKLEDFCQVQDSLPPERLSDLLWLMGDASDELPHFVPDLVPITGTGTWPYEFEVMRRPLTVAEARALSPMLAGDRGNNLLPFRFLPRERFSCNSEFYQNLYKELMAIVRLMRSQADKDRGLLWDVPTAGEWRRLAGCERQSFPWGDEFETGRANLWIEGHTPRILPVGSFRGGASQHGVDDCCGNVHEVVRIADGNEFPHNFGLMGKSYRTPPRTADCRFTGHFRPRNSDNRWNIGIRLIRYRGSDEFKRFL
jgi:hypothetical protein